MKNIKYFNHNNTPCALSNLLGLRRDVTVQDILDVVEDSKTVQDLEKGINSLNLMRKFKVDRVTETYARLKSVDRLGNIEYIKAEFD